VPANLKPDAARPLDAASTMTSPMPSAALSACARQPNTCAVGSEAIVAFGQKTQSSANVIYDLVNRQANGDEAPLGPRNPEERAHKPSQDTLTLLDRADGVVRSRI